MHARMQVPIGRLLAIHGRFAWVRASVSDDGRFITWSAGGKQPRGAEGDGGQHGKEAADDDDDDDGCDAVAEEPPPKTATTVKATATVPSVVPARPKRAAPDGHGGARMETEAKEGQGPKKRKERDATGKRKRRRQAAQERKRAEAQAAVAGTS